MKSTKLENFKKSLLIKSPILGVFFVSDLPSGVKHYKDTACTAIARSFFNKKTVILNNSGYAQLCLGADYFLGLSKKILAKEVIQVYTKDECVFKDKEICRKYINCLPRFPKDLEKKSIILKPLKPNDKPQLVLMLVNPAQAGKILGLANYNNYKNIIINPSQPTCISLFAPLVTKKVHINFIDYYDRYYQGIIRGKKIWPEGKMITSMTLAQFEEVGDNLDLSPYGNFVSDLHPKEVDDI